MHVEEAVRRQEDAVQVVIRLEVSVEHARRRLHDEGRVLTRGVLCIKSEGEKRNKTDIKGQKKKGEGAISKIITIVYPQG